jgi:hypothetical protein
MVKELIMADFTPEEIVADVKKAHPKCKLNAKAVAWYRWNMIKKGEVPKGYEVLSSRVTRGYREQLEAGAPPTSCAPSIRPNHPGL